MIFFFDLGVDFFTFSDFQGAGWPGTSQRQSLGDQDFPRKTSKKRSTYLLVIAGLCIMPPSLAQNGEIPRTADGKPDFSGTYDVSTLTPFQRPSRFGNRLILTNDEAFGIANANFGPVA